MPTRLGYQDYTIGGESLAHFDSTEAPEGSWMVAVLAWSDGTGADVQAVPPSGWTPLFGKQQIGSRAMQAWGRTKQPGDGEFSWSTSSGTSKYLYSMWGEGAVPVEEWVVGLVGVRSSSNVVPGQSVQAGTSTTTVCPSVDAPTDSLILSLSVEATSAAETGVTNIEGATEWFFALSSEAWSIETLSASYNESTEGQTDPITITYPNSQPNNSGGFQLALPPAAPPEPEQPGILTELQDGRTARATIIVNGDRLVPLTRKILRRGFDNVDHLLNTPGATWAHRGGSDNWPEMSNWAYDQSAFRGFGALEFSAQRTSDGWWFGLHDNDLNRTSMTTGTPAPSASTRAQVEGYQINLNAAGRSRPYYGMIEFLDKWTDTHVVIVDPKNQLGHQSEFLDILDAHGGPEKIIVKYYGVGSGSIALANAATARGYETWGYYYQGNYGPGEIENTQQHWSILGLEITATTAWTGEGDFPSILSYEKPVVGHIASSQAAYDLGVSKGATMIQCSNVAGISPVSSW